MSHLSQYMIGSRIVETTPELKAALAGVYACEREYVCVCLWVKTWMEYVH